MFTRNFKIDERTRSNSRYAAAIWLGVTQLMLVGVIFYRLYILGQADEEIRDFQTVLAISLFGYIGLQLVLGGIMPVLSWRGMLLGYLVLTSAIVIVCLIVYGWPAADEWADTWLPSLLGPAILIGAYSLVSKLGQWNINRRLGPDE